MTIEPRDKVYEFELDLPPNTNNLFPTAVHKGKAHRFKSGEYTDWQAAARHVMAKYPLYKFTEGDVTVLLRVYEGGKQARRDIDSYIKPMLDIMTGVCYNDDRQVSKVLCERFDGKDDPRIVVLLLASDNTWH